MIIRFGGGESGIVEYLERGAKLGRNYSRSELDERVVLAGDLAATGAIIDSMDTKAGVERYLHITHSFKEDYIEPEVLEAITDASKSFYLSAYRDSELNFYTEAHLPKIKEYVGNQGEIVDRKVHTHCVIPKVNLTTGKREDPIGYMAAKYGSKYSTFDLIKAFQEDINDRYGLASPDEVMGTKDRSMILERHKFTHEETAPQKFLREGTELRQEIMRAVISRGITTRKDFQKLLGEYGEVSVPSARAPYFKIKVAGNAKNYRLDDKMFSDDFLALPALKKIKLLSADHKHEFIVAKPPEQIQAEANAKARAQRAEMIEYWHKVRAREIRYINPNSKYMKEVYRHLSTEQRIAVLDRLEAGEEVTGLDLSLPAPTSSKLNRYTAEQIEENLAAGKLLLSGDDVAIVSMLDEMTQMQSSFTSADMERYLLERIDIVDLPRALEMITAHKYFVALGDGRITSRKVHEIETEMIERAHRMKTVNGGAISYSGIDISSMNPGQKAVMTALCSGAQVAIANGAAGTGKSYVLARVKEAYEEQGFKLYGALLQGKTAQDLEADSGIKSSTMHSFLAQVDSGKIKLDNKSVIIVDEAGMVGSEQTARILALAEQYGCRIRAVGDIYQVQAVSYGSAFDKVSEIFGTTELTQIMRQKTGWQLDASMSMSRHDIKAGIDAYNDHGLIQFENDHFDAIDALAEQVRQDRLGGMDGSSIVICKTRAERTELNATIRAALIEDGVVSATEHSHLVNTDGRKIDLAKGDSVMFMRSYKDLGVKNGTMGKIDKIDDENIHFNVDGRVFAVPKETMLDVEQGYAITINKSQGMTVNRAYVLASKHMTANDVYVAMTRHKDAAKLYASREHFKSVEEMISKVSSRAEKAFSGESNEVDRTVVDSLIRSQSAEMLIEREAARIKVRQLNQEIHLPDMLNRLERKIGLDPDKFQLCEPNRIEAGGKQYTAVDFLVQICNQDYKSEALPFLREVYQYQLQDVYVERQPPIKLKERKEFACWLKARDRSIKEEISLLNQAARPAKSSARARGDIEALAAIQSKLEIDRGILDARLRKSNRELFDEFRALNSTQMDDTKDIAVSQDGPSEVEMQSSEDGDAVQFRM